MTTKVSNIVYSLFPLDSIKEGTPEVAQAAWAMLQVCSHGLCLAVLARVPPAVHFVAQRSHVTGTGSCQQPQHMSSGGRGAQKGSGAGARVQGFSGFRVVGGGETHGRFG